jgi:hypothetical protein
MSTSRDEQLHRTAVELVRAAYEVTDRMRNVDLAAINEPRPPILRYHAPHEVVREFMARANGMLELAGKLGLIDGEEDGEIRRTAAPELAQWLLDEDKRLSAES